MLPDIESRNWRTEKLNDELLNVKPEICVERARLVTESYKQTEGEPIVVRRAKALRNVLTNMTIFIQKDQLVVGNQASKLRSSPVFPETEAGYLEDEIDLFEKREQDRLIVPSEVKKELLNDILPYWKNKTTKEIALKAMPYSSRELVELEYQLFSVGIHLTGSIGHVIVDYDEVLEKGILGIKKEITEKMEQLDFANPENVSKHAFYEAELIICDSVIQWADRFSQKAEELAKKENDLEWKRELEAIAEICKRVPAYPSTNFREAVQSFWFIHLLLFIEQNGLAVSPGRFDQYMYKYLRKSLDEESKSKQEMQELLECLWIKFTEIMRAYDYECAKYYAGFSISENIVLSGLDRHGNDATNELSYMCLEAERNTLLSQPNLGIRVHPGTPDEFLLKAIEVISSGRTKPEIFNDNVGIPSLMSVGVSLEEARNYSISGCVEAVPPHCNGMTNSAMSNIAKALELALNNGVCRLSGKQVGLKTGDPKEFNSYEDVVSAFRSQVEFYVNKMVGALNIIERVHAEVYPLPYFSLVMKDCIEEGLDITGGGARYNYSGPQAVGLADVADSLAAIKKLVFENRDITLGEILSAIECDFNGYEDLKHTLINKAPKWGNDDDYVDVIACEVADIYCGEVSKYRNTRGGPYRPGIYSVSANVPLGLHVGAMPNGRLSTTPLADGVAPVHGCDKYGPTAVVRSVAKLDHEIISNGTILNLKYTPALLKDSAGKENLASLIRSYFDLGGWHIQFNVVSADKLRLAQEKPEEHKGLIIRVAGYSAFFTELDKAVQDDIIDRTEYRSF